MIFEDNVSNIHSKIDPEKISYITKTLKIPRSKRES